jgi:hypothetical protein
MRYWLVLIAVLFVSGCAGGPKVYKTDFEKGSVLVLPARDVIQDNKPHEKGVGSGQLLTDKTVEYLTKAGFVATKAKNDKLDNVNVTSKEDAISEATEVGTEYYLQMTLGEFRNAAPMTFRTDFVTLEKATLVDVNSGQEVWRLEKPILLEKSNLGNHLGLLDDLAKIVSDSISKS